METNGNQGPIASTLAPPVRRDERVSPNVRVRKTLTGEAVPAAGYHYKQQQILSSTVDEVEVELSLATYDRMENDPTIAKDKMILITSVLSDDLQMSPHHTEGEVGPEEFDICVEIMEFCERIWQGLGDTRSMCEQWFGNSIKYGHGIGEIEWEYRLDAPSTKPPEKPKGAMTSFRDKFMMWFGAGPQMAEETDTPERPVLKGEKMRLMPKSIKIKPRGAAQFVVDDFMNVLGMTPSRSFGRDPILKWNEIITREKFAILTLNKQNEDPRGKSKYRAAYNWYNLKVQTPAEMLRYILEEITPKGIATLPPEGKSYEQEVDDNGVPQYNEDGSPKMITIVQSFLNAMSNFRGGASAVIPYDSKIEPYRKGLTGSNDANLFKTILKIVDDQMENAILNQTMAQSEGENQGRSASEQVAEILYLLQFWYRWKISQAILQDIFAPAVEKNFGEWALRYLPVVSLGDFARRDWVEDLKAIADAYFKGFIDDSQREELAAWLNLPKPGQSRQEMEMENGAKLDVNGNPVQNNQQRPDKQAGSKNRNAGNGTEKGVKKRNARTDIGISPLNLLGHHRRGIGRFARYISRS